MVCTAPSAKQLNLNFFILNSSAKHSVNVINAPTYGVAKKDMLNDLSLLTGATIINEDLGDDMDLIHHEHLGQAKKIVSSKDNTIIQVDKTPVEVEDLISYENTEDHKKERNKQEYFIQVTTSSSLNKIEKNRKYLESYGYNPFIKETEGKNGKIWYKLKLGPYNYNKADSISNDIFKNLGLETRINNE